MDNRTAIAKVKKMVERCAYSTLGEGVLYVAMQIDGGSSVRVENKDTIWTFRVKGKAQPKLITIIHKKKNNKKKGA